MTAERSQRPKQPSSQSTSPFTVGVTGGIGSGKTSVTEFFSSKGIDIVDADIASRVVIEPGKPALSDIKRRYGSKILLDGNLDRRRLRTIIFEDADERQWLEGLLHPLILDQIILELTRAESNYAVLVSPLMLETSQHELVDRVLVVDVPESIQLARAMARDQMTEKQARQILNSQMERQKRVARADDIVDNSGSISQLHRSLEQLHEFYLSLA
ncbi:dephospho-CoA kinase [Endozoicomonas sp. ONNA2]|uniref:dephospho-CoA kinase n=1 Tax=Endozoicomonas sp. ONNA2 TaxID=2828741 RepID=UPI0021487DE3|nr:dephospho-CoA kinase [Endozoicomonas sp. ONNA2]